MTKRVLAGVVAGAVVLVAGAAAVVVPKITGDDQSSVIEAEGQNLLPSETLEDWVTYSDHVAVVKLASTRDIPASDEEVKAGEGYIPRATTYEITSVLWSRKGAREAPSTIETDIDGWSFKEGTKTPVKLKGQPLLDKIGNVYVMPIVYLEKTASVGVAGWSNLSPDSILPFEDDVVGRGDSIIGDDGRTKAVDQLWGQSRQDLTSTLSEQRPDPAAEPFMSDPPDVRYNRAFEASNPPGEPSDGEKVDENN